MQVDATRTGKGEPGADALREAALTGKKNALELDRFPRFFSYETF